MDKREIIEDGDYKVTIDYENMTTTFELSDKQHGWTRYLNQGIVLKGQ